MCFLLVAEWTGVSKPFPFVPNLKTESMPILYFNKQKIGKISNNSSRLMGELVLMVYTTQVLSLYGKDGYKIRYLKNLNPKPDNMRK